MPKTHEFARNEILPSYFMNAIQEALSGVRMGLRISRVNATTVQVVPLEPQGLASVVIQGRWRYRSTAVNRAHPGGASGTYTLWAVATDQAVDNVPDPFTDHTDWSFSLRITSGGNPSGAGVEIFEKIGEIDWDGVAIEAIRQTAFSVGGVEIEDGAILAGTGLAIVRQSSGALQLSVAGGVGLSYVTSLPGSPTDGQEVAYGADPANDVLWHLRYRTAVAKWEFLGGPPLRSAVDSGLGYSSPYNAYKDLSGPALVAPLDGTYDIHVGTALVGGGAPNGYMSYSIGAAAALDADACTMLGTETGNAAIGHRRKSIAAATTVASRFKADASGTFSRTWLELQPVSIG